MLVVVALGVVYLVWGSTYLGIRVVVDQAPPLASMGSRYLLAGLLLAVALSVRRGIRRLAVSRRELAGAALLGLLLPMLGNGMVSIAESMGAPSGVTAVLIAIAPLMIMLFRFASGDRPRLLSVVGIVLGFAGLSYLVLAGHASTESGFTLLSAGIILFASTCWAFGSWIQPRLTLPADAFVTTAYEMMIGGLIMLAVSLARGERLHPTEYDARTWLAWGYLVIFGSLVAFTAYVWLLANAPIGLVATYAYVNPVVAVVLGAVILAEPITAPVLIGGGVVVAAVAIVISVERPRRPVPDPDVTAEVG